MTFVIARIAKNGIRIDSDSKLTDPKVIQSSPLSGAIKTVLLDRSISISYAGSVHCAQKAIEHLFSIKERLTEREVVSELLELNKKSNNETDYLVVSIQKSPTIYRIKKGTVETSNLVSWIGDHSAFNLFQKEFVSKSQNVNNFDMLKLQGEIFQKIISNPNVQSVGGFQITAHSTKFGLQYLIKTETRFGFQQIKIKGPGTYILPLGSAQNGAYSTSYLVSDNVNKPAVAIHFPQGNFGGLIYPRRSRYIEIIKEVDGREFVQKVKENYRIKLTGLIVENDRFRMI